MIVGVLIWAGATAVLGWVIAEALERGGFYGGGRG